MTANPTPLNQEELEKYVSEMLHHQMMVDRGGDDWYSHGEKLATMIAEYPAKLQTHTQSQVEKAKVEQTQRIKRQTTLMNHQVAMYWIDKELASLKEKK